MKTKCEHCGKSQKIVGRLLTYQYQAITLKVCKSCKKELKLKQGGYI